jgi:hypothetical protein
MRVGEKEAKEGGTMRDRSNMSEDVRKKISDSVATREDNTRAPYCRRHSVILLSYVTYSYLPVINYESTLFIVNYNYLSNLSPAKQHLRLLSSPN